MAKKKQRRADAESLPEWWRVGGPFAVVLAMLLLGAVLKSSADGAEAAAPDTAGDRAPLDLAAVSAEDVSRLAEHPGAWTLQFMMACERANLEPLVEALDDQPNFFLLPYPATGRECYRVCWGHFESKAEAERPRAYPDALRDVKAIPWATPVSNVLP